MYNISIPIEKYNINFIKFLDKQKNVVLENGFFTKIIYSPPFNITLNSLYISVTGDNDLQSIYNLEIDLLDNYKMIETLTKEPNFTISNYFHKNRLNNKVILKISGIWEKVDSFGLNYIIINE